MPFKLMLNRRLSVILWISVPSNSFEPIPVLCEYEIEIVDTENSLNNIKIENTTGKKAYPGTSIGLLYKKNEIYLPRDVLTIRTRIWRQRFAINVTEGFSFKTHIPVKYYKFNWLLNDLFCPKTESSVTKSFEYFFKAQTIVRLELTKVFHLNNIHVEISVDSNESFSWKLDARVSKTKERFLFANGKKNLNSLCKRRYLPLLTLQNIEKKDLLNGCALELDICFGIISHDLKCHSENFSLQYSRADSLWATCCESVASPPDCDEKTKDDSVLHAMRTLYSEGFMSDFNIKVLNKTFRVHSTILAMRSPVLRRMLETDMKEKQDKTLILNDLDVDTVARMLRYLYTDDLCELNPGIAFTLYYVGDKYEIPGLKRRTSKFLRDNLNYENVFSVLELADRHGDEILKAAAFRFIQLHEDTVLACKEFQSFSNRNSVLANEILLKFGKLQKSLIHSTEDCLNLLLS